MSETLREALRRAAESAPVPRLDGQLWRRGRRRRRMRRAATTLAGLLLVAGLATLPGLAGGGVLPGPAQGDVIVGSLGKPFPWQLSHEAGPNGPVVAVFTDDDTFSAGAGVLVGQDGSYRLLPIDPGKELGLVSPDGRHLARDFQLVDLVTGRVGAVYGRPLAWSPDGRRLLLWVDRADGFTRQYVDGAESDPARPDEIVVYDLDTDQSLPIMNVDTAPPVGAFAPDGDRIAVSYGTADSGLHQLVIVDDITGSPSTSHVLTGEQRLAGPAAWTPDGRSVVLTVADGCAWSACQARPDSLRGWRMQYVDAATGAVTDEEARGRAGLPRALAGWRDGLPVFVEGGRFSPPELVVARPGGGREVLLAGPAGAGELDVPRDLVEHGTFGVYTANPLQAQPWAFVGLAACLAPPVVLLVVLRLRRRALRALPGLRVGQGAGPDDLRAEGGDAVA
ncbi:TolB family protein [Catellatospora vulcania]|uniref:TolB family protein n=1 Tax=Catellatospora vulcania TaxID=1460450 RepID=UPI0012D490CD|nr:hypothetical protein [Catellatospora vulcania]